MFDKASKNFILRCWRARQNVIGEVSVRNGVILHERPAVRVLRAPSAKRYIFDAHNRWEWRGWVRRDPSFAVRRQGAAKAFFVVLCGRKVGVFYRWCDALASVAGFPGAKFRGFDSEAHARRALQDGHFDDCDRAVV